MVSFALWLVSDDASLYRIAAGKEKLDYDAIDEGLQVQKFEVERIFVFTGYNDVTGNYQADIAMAVLKKTITFQAHVVPICIPYNLKYDDANVEPGTIGDHHKTNEIARVLD